MGPFRLHVADGMVVKGSIVHPNVMLLPTQIVPSTLRLTSDPAKKKKQKKTSHVNGYTTLFEGHKTFAESGKIEKKCFYYRHRLDM